MPERVRQSAEAVFTANWGVIPTAFICTLYLAIMIVARWRLIADPTRRFLAARLDEIEAWLGCFDEGDARTASTLVAAKGLLAKARKDVEEPGLGYHVIWSGSRELAAWKTVHAIECLLAPCLPDDQVRARLATARADLAGNAAADADALAAAIDAALAPGASKPETRKYLLQRALEVIYRDSDSGFAALSNWDNKTMWLVHVAVVAIITAAAVLGHPAYLLVGAIGGAVSRMSRVRREAADATPTDYGASWTSLFLSPLAGALAGWAGVFLMQVAVKLQILGAAIAVNWDGYDRGSITLGFAFAFGFSERLMDGLVSQLESKGTAQGSAAGKDDKASAEKEKAARDKAAAEKAAADKAAADKAAADKAAADKAAADGTT